MDEEVFCLLNIILVRFRGYYLTLRNVVTVWRHSVEWSDYFKTLNLAVIIIFNYNARAYFRMLLPKKRIWDQRREKLYIKLIHELRLRMI